MDAANKLILLAGLPRSGTSWLGKILDSHPDTAYRSEPDNFPHLEDLPLFPGTAHADRYRHRVNEFAAGLARLNTYRRAAKPPLFPKRYRSMPGHQVFRAAAFGARIGTRFNRDWPVAGARVDRVRPPPTMVWKSVRSLGRLGLLCRTLPGMIGIHLIRHPCGQVNSILRGEHWAVFDGRTAPSEQYGIFKLLIETPAGRRHGLTLDELRALTPAERLAWQWVLVNEISMDETGGDRHVRLIRYEDVCSDPVNVAREIFAHCELAWHARTGQFIRASTSGGNRRYFSVFKDPVESVNRWRRDLAGEQVRGIVAIVRRSPRLSALYELDGAPLPAAAGMR